MHVQHSHPRAPQRAPRRAESKVLKFLSIGVVNEWLDVKFEVMAKAGVEVEVGYVLRTVTERLESYMIFRGWTLVLMIFVTSGGM